MSNLSGLPHDLLVIIAKGLKKLEEFVSFKCVCKSMFTAAKDEYFEGLRLRQQTPYLMLPVKDGNDDVRELYSLVEGESFMASIRVPKFNTKKCIESLGWLLVSLDDGNVSLLEPFSGTEIPLPHQSTVPGGYANKWLLPHVFIHKMVLSSRPNESSDFILMIIYGGFHQLAFWRLGDKAWNGIDNYKHFVDVEYHGCGTFYAIADPANIFFIKFAQNDCNPECGEIMGFKRILNKVSKMYLPKVDWNRECGEMMGLELNVLSDSELLNPPPLEEEYYPCGTTNFYILKSVEEGLLFIVRIIPKLSEDGSAYMTSKFVVFELDTMMKSCKEIYSLGSMAVFIGHNSTIAVDASRFSGGAIKPNRIYFTEDDFEFYFFQSAKGGGKDMGIYNMETRTIEPVHPDEPLQSKVSTSMWINPSAVFLSYVHGLEWCPEISVVTPSDFMMLLILLQSCRIQFPIFSSLMKSFMERNYAILNLMKSFIEGFPWLIRSFNGL